MSEVITERGDPRDRITNQLSLPRRAAAEPLLRPEKTKRWPEDFRGFGTNVRPKKQK